MAGVVPLGSGDPGRAGPYELSGRLGRGGQGTVYLGRLATGEGVPVAVKILHPQFTDDPKARARLLREASVARRVARFCTAQVLDVGEDDERIYLVSEYVQGTPLTDLLEAEGPRTGVSLERLAISTVTALAAIHEAGVVHLDFKPANILIGRDGPIVIDFGIARALDTATATTGQLVGSPAYMAPEQYSGTDVGPAADMFAWGVTLVHAATGQPAFGLASAPTMMQRVLFAEPELDGLEPPLRDLVSACLAKDPSARPTARQALLTLIGQTSPDAAAPSATGEAASPSGLLAPGAVPVVPEVPVALSADPFSPVGAAWPDTPSPAMRGGSGSSSGPSPSASRGVEAPATADPGGASEFPGTSASTDPMPPGFPMVPTVHGPMPPGAPMPPSAAMSPGTATPPSAAMSPGAAAGPDSGRRRGKLPAIVGAVVGVAVVAVGAAVAVSMLRGSGRTDGNQRSSLGTVGGTTGAPSSVAAGGARGIQGSGATQGTTPTPKPTPSASGRHGKAAPPAAPDKSYTPPAAPAGGNGATKIPWSLTQICGSGMRVVDSHALGRATVYLMYDDATGVNCVTTTVPSSTGPQHMSASLTRKGGSPNQDSGSYSFYAGPVKASARGVCVTWGGSYGSDSWSSGWSHCG
jgi:serine/threonine protein kinase